MLRNSTQYVRANGQGRLLAAMLFWTLLPALPTAAQTAPTPATEAGRPRMTICVHDYAGVPDQTLRQAFEEAQRIFREAGIEIDWVFCPTSGSKDARCEALSVGADKSLNIIPRGNALIPTRPKALGFTPTSKVGRTGVLAYVFYARVLEEAEPRGWPAVAVLALVMVHEVGHMILGKEHSTSGIMRPNCGEEMVKEMVARRLAFSAGQAQQMQEQFNNLLMSAK